MPAARRIRAPKMHPRCGRARNFAKTLRFYILIISDSFLRGAPWKRPKRNCECSAARSGAASIYPQGRVKSLELQSSWRAYLRPSQKRRSISSLWRTSSVVIGFYGINIGRGACWHLTRSSTSSTSTTSSPITPYPLHYTLDCLLTWQDVFWQRFGGLRERYLHPVVQEPAFGVHRVAQPDPPLQEEERPQQEVDGGRHQPTDEPLRHRVAPGGRLGGEGHGERGWLLGEPSPFPCSCPSACQLFSKIAAVELHPWVPG